MKSVTNNIISGVIAAFFASEGRTDGLRESVLRDAATSAGFVQAEETHIHVEEDLVAIGQLLFESRLLSSDEDTACASCHIDQFGSADGIPIAIGTEGEGIGKARIENGGDIIPRNALPFWGRGGIGFDVFFWDGRVDASSGTIISQFGDDLPSDDPLVVAVHLPPVQIGEMVLDHDGTKYLQTEQVTTATVYFSELASRIQNDPALGPALALAKSKDIENLVFLDIAEAIAAFIRSNFRIKSTRFHDFVFSDGSLSEHELEGGLLFYGRGGCVSCHNGPYFSDFNYHSIPFPQLGFGPNGFGVDYGRFNVTLENDDIFRFRTPPLYNVTKTAPYSHSGSVQLLADAISTHIDPLKFLDPSKMTTNDRVQYYERLKKWSLSPINGVVLSEPDVAAIESFLGTLSYESDATVEIVD